jgi:uncharacterized membrane protein YphA (DoxX/SURF4 family)
LLGVVALVLLRLTVGWHILYEGLHKLHQDDFSAEGFLSQTSGPFEQFFQYKVIPDFEGSQRLTKSWNFDRLDDYHQRFVAQFNLEGEQRTIADRALEARKANLARYLDEPGNAKLISDNAAAWAALNAKKQAEREGKLGAPFEHQRLWEATQKLRGDIRPALKWVKDQHAGLKNDLKNVLPVAQRDGAEVSYSFFEQLKNPDRVVTFACIAIGFCLMIGLCTKFAAVGGAMFLGMIFLSRLEWPGFYMPPTHPAQGNSLFITKEFIEMMCCVVLATVPVGRWGGLDFILHSVFVRPFCKSKDSSQT